MDELTKFIKWFVRPYNQLKRIRHGDGGFVILSIGLSLCERYFRIKANCITKDSLPDRFYKVAARKFKCSTETFEIFWNVYRHGIMHRGQPQKWIKVWNTQKTKKIKMKTGWLFNDGFGFKPTECRNGENLTICINPHKFTSFVLKLFLDKPELLRRSVRHQFGHIFHHAPNPICV